MRSHSLAGALVMGPRGMTPNGELVINVGIADERPSDIEGLWSIGLDGSNPVRVLEDGASYPLSSLAPIDLSANGRYVSMYSFNAIARMDIKNAFHLADVQTGEVNPVEIDGSRYVLGPPLFSPASSHALLQGGPGQIITLYMLDLETGTTSPVAGSRDMPFFNWFETPPTWAGNNTVFIPHEGSGTLITLEHDS